MAAKEKDNKDNGTEEKKKKSPVLFIIIGVVILLIAAGGAYFFLFSTPSDEELANEIAQESNGPAATEKALDLKVGFMMELDPFIVNLADPKARHFVKTTITLELKNEGVKDEVERLMPKIRNDIILLLSSQTMEDILTMDGKIRLRDQLIARVNRILGEGRLLNVYFSRLVVQ